MAKLVIETTFGTFALVFLGFLPNFRTSPGSNVGRNVQNYLTIHFSLFFGIENFLHDFVDNGQFFDIVDAEAFDRFENRQCDDLFALRK